MPVSQTGRKRSSCRRVLIVAHAAETARSVRRRFKSAVRRRARRHRALTGHRTPTLPSQLPFAHQDPAGRCSGGGEEIVDLTEMPQAERVMKAEMAAALRQQHLEILG